MATKKQSLIIGEAYHDADINRTMIYMGFVDGNKFVHKFKHVSGEILLSDFEIGALTKIKN